ncbi:MAG: glycine--tRNA ligase subunit beta [Aquificaceae bacterium]|nr:MAG: glycine--tRNA ligase subunit beta [Aquificaceae bacterium]
MADVKDVFIEIGTEELPPKALLTLSKAFSDGIVAGFNDASLQAKEVIPYAAPRRLAVLLKDMPTRQADQLVERRGPAIKAAFDDEGNPSRAAQGFAGSCGVDVADLERMQTDKGEWLVFKKEVKGKATQELVADIVSKSLSALPIPKRMRWGASDIEFVRPVHWIVMMLGNETVDAEVMGIKAGNETRGHRFHHPEKIPLSHPADYAKLLKETGYVIADYAERREMVRQQAEAAAKAVGGVAHIDNNLLDEVTALIEWPIAVSGSFDKEFLDIPQECLISSMQDHQKYFPVVDSSGALLPYFITIANIDSKNPDAVRQGNERVIRPRFSDAAFFWQQDGKVTLESRREATKKIFFQQKLGTLFEKTERVAELSQAIAKQLGANTSDAYRAATLSKCDLMSDMVGEFAELQGIMGRYYAQRDGETAEVADAMQQQYQPAFADDVIPASMTGKILSLADRLDTLLGIFAIGLKPTGSKDPYALRRAAIGVLRILIEGELSLDLKALLTIAAKGLSNKVDASAAVDDTYAFIMERLRAYYKDKKIAGDVVDAVASVNPSRPLDFNQRVKAVTQFRELDAAEPLAAANKRIGNILKKAKGTIPDAVDTSVLVEDAEKTLYQTILKQSETVSPLFADAKYTEALSSLADLRADVDNFFDSVMVMADDEALKNNRLALLQQMRNLFLHVADLSRLQ